MQRECPGVTRTDLVVGSRVMVCLASSVRRPPLPVYQTSVNTGAGRLAGLTVVATS
jgi:hypothetical protein